MDTKIEGQESKVKGPPEVKVIAAALNEREEGRVGSILELLWDFLFGGDVEFPAPFLHLVRLPTGGKSTSDAIQKRRIKIGEQMAWR